MINKEQQCIYKHIRGVQIDGTKMSSTFLFLFTLKLFFFFSTEIFVTSDFRESTPVSEEYKQRDAVARMFSYDHSIFQHRV